MPGTEDVNLGDVKPNREVSGPVGERILRYTQRIISPLAKNFWSQMHIHAPKMVLDVERILDGQDVYNRQFAGMLHGNQEIIEKWAETSPIGAKVLRDYEINGKLTRKDAGEGYGAATFLASLPEQGVPEEVQEAFANTFKLNKKARAELISRGKAIPLDATPQGISAADDVWAPLGPEYIRKMQVQQAEIAKGNIELAEQIGQEMAELREQMPDATRAAMKKLWAMTEVITDDEIVPRVIKDHDKFKPFFTAKRDARLHEENPYAGRLVEFANQRRKNLGQMTEATRLEELSDEEFKAARGMLQDQFDKDNIGDATTPDHILGETDTRRIMDAKTVSEAHDLGIYASNFDAIRFQGQDTSREAAVWRMLAALAPQRFSEAFDPAVYIRENEGKPGDLAKGWKESIRLRYNDMVPIIADRFTDNVHSNRQMQEMLNGFIKEHYLARPKRSRIRTMAHAVAAIQSNDPSSLAVQVTDIIKPMVMNHPRDYLEGLGTLILGKHGVGIHTQRKILQDAMHDLQGLWNPKDKVNFINKMSLPMATLNHGTGSLIEHVELASVRNLSRRTLADMATYTTPENFQRILSEIQDRTKTGDYLRALVGVGMNKMQPITQTGWHYLDRAKWSHVMAPFLALRRYMLNQLSLASVLVHDELAAPLARGDYASVASGLARLAAYAAVVGGAEYYIRRAISPVSPFYWSNTGEQERKRLTWGKTALDIFGNSMGLQVNLANAIENPVKEATRQFAPTGTSVILSPLTEGAQALRMARVGKDKFNKTAARPLGGRVLQNVPIIGEPLSTIYQRNFRKYQVKSKDNAREQMRIRQPGYLTPRKGQNFFWPKTEE